MSDDFSTRYRLLKCVLVEDGIRTHNAQEVASGKVVMVHISDAAGPDEVESLRTQMAGLDMIQKRQILETATLPSGFAVVTEFLPGALSFGAWLAKHAAPREMSPPPDAVPPTMETTPPAPQPEHILGNLTLSASSTAEPASEAQPSGSKPTDPVSAADSFTALFGAPKDPSAFDDGVREVKSGTGSKFGLSMDRSAANDFSAGSLNAPSDPVASHGSPPAPTPVPAPAPAPRAPSASAPPPAVAPPGEFTMMFSPNAAALAANKESPASPATNTTPAAKGPLSSGAPVLEVPHFAEPIAPDRPSDPDDIPTQTKHKATTKETGEPIAPATPQPSPFAWDALPEAAPVAKAPPGEFTMMFGAPSTAAPMPEQVRRSPMREAPPPTFSPLTPGAQLESPPVEPMHRVMSNNPSYAAGIQQEGLSPISNNLGGGGYAGSLSNRYPAGPGAAPPSSSAYSSQNAGARYSGMPEFNPAPPPAAYPPAHASPLTTPQPPGPNDPARPSGMPGILPPPIFGNGGSTPLSALGGAASIVNASAGPSEYTQLIAHGAAPVVPELKPAASAATEAKRGGRRLPTGLIVVINAILLIAALLLFFVFKQQIPTTQTVVPRGPVMPNVPKAPQLPK